MHTAAGAGDGTRKRRPIRRIVILTILLVVLIEPLIMYRTLMQERAERRAVADSSLTGPNLDLGRSAGR